MWTPLDGMRDWSIFSNSFLNYSYDILPGLIGSCFIYALLNLVHTLTASTLSHWLVMLSVCFICPGDTVQTGTVKVDPARKFKCTTAARHTFVFYNVWLLKIDKINCLSVIFCISILMTNLHSIVRYCTWFCHGTVHDFVNERNKLNVSGNHLCKKPYMYTV